MKVLREELGLKIEYIRESVQLREIVKEVHAITVDFMETMNMLYCVRTARCNKQENTIHQQITNMNEGNTNLNSRKIAEEMEDKLKRMGIELPSQRPSIPEPAHTREDIGIDRYPESGKGESFSREPSWEDLYPS